jgi:hypothetical protein
MNKLISKLKDEDLYLYYIGDGKFVLRDVNGVLQSKSPFVPVPYSLTNDVVTYTLDCDLDHLNKETELELEYLPDTWRFLNPVVEEGSIPEIDYSNIEGLEVNPIETISNECESLRKTAEAVEDPLLEIMNNIEHKVYMLGRIECQIDLKIEEFEKEVGELRENKRALEESINTWKHSLSIVRGKDGRS